LPKGGQDSAAVDICNRCNVKHAPGSREGAGRRC